MPHIQEIEKEFDEKEGIEIYAYSMKDWQLTKEFWLSKLKALSQSHQKELEEEIKKSNSGKVMYQRGRADVLEEILKEVEKLDQVGGRGIKEWYYPVESVKSIINKRLNKDV